MFDYIAVEFFNASLVADFAEYYLNFFDKLDLEAHEHQVETARRSQEVGTDRILNDQFENPNKLPVAFAKLLKLVKTLGGRFGALHDSAVFNW